MHPEKQKGLAVEDWPTLALVQETRCDTEPMAFGVIKHYNISYKEFERASKKMYLQWLEEWLKTNKPYIGADALMRKTV